MRRELNLATIHIAAWHTRSFLFLSFYFSFFSHKEGYESAYLAERCHMHAIHSIRCRKCLSVADTGICILWANENQSRRMCGVYHKKEREKKTCIKLEQLSSSQILKSKDPIQARCLTRQLNDTNTSLHMTVGCLQVSRTSIDSLKEKDKAHICM